MVRNSQGAELAEQRNNFIDTLSHDLKIPLIGAGRVLDLLAEGKVGASTEEREKLLQQLSDNNRDILLRINEIIDTYRYQSELQNERKSFCNVDLILQEAVVRACVKTREKNLKIKLDSNFTDLFKAKSDALSKLFDNLLDNSIRSTCKDGTISIKTARVDHRLHFEITDSGPGMLDGDKSQLFRRMLKVPGSTDSSHGLNLYICGEIVRDHGGEIKVEGANGSGTKFSFWLPMKPEKISASVEDS